MNITAVIATTIVVNIIAATKTVETALSSINEFFLFLFRICTIHSFDFFPSSHHFRVL